jgi:hypothetical protein
MFEGLLDYPVLWDRKMACGQDVLDLVVWLKGVRWLDYHVCLLGKMAYDLAPADFDRAN